MRRIGGLMGNRHEDRRDIILMERALKVKSLRLAGLTYLQIADKLGVSEDTVRRDLRKIKVEFPARTARELVALQNDKLEAMMTPHFIKAIAGDPKHTDAMVKLLKHQAELFNLQGVKLEEESSKAVEKLNEFFALIRSDSAVDGGVED